MNIARQRTASEAQHLQHNMHAGSKAQHVQEHVREGLEDSRPIYAKHVTNMMMAYEAYGTPDVRPSSAPARHRRLLCAAARPRASREKAARKLLATHLAGHHNLASDPHRVAYDRAHG